MATLYIVVPCYNEQEVLAETNKRLNAKLKDLVACNRCDNESRILYVDDGSRDNTWELITQYHRESEYVCGLKLAHNKGHQNALLAGLMAAREFCDCAISMDADLQDDIEVLDAFMDRFSQGYEVVYGVRKRRDTDTVFKRATAQGFYKLMKALGVDIVYNHADYRLLGKRALEGLSRYKEVNLFLRGIIPHIGFKSTEVYYDRGNRFAGESKYPLKKMLYFAFDGITSFSVKPLKIITNCGIFFLILSILGLLYSLLAAMLGFAPPAVSAIICAMAFFSSLVLIALGTVGSYVGKIYAEVKERPRYIVEQFLK